MGLGSELRAALIRNLLIVKTNLFDDCCFRCVFTGQPTFSQRIRSISRQLAAAGDEKAPELYEMSEFSEEYSEDENVVIEANNMINESIQEQNVSASAIEKSASGVSSYVKRNITDSESEI